VENADPGGAEGGGTKRAGEVTLVVGYSEMRCSRVLALVLMASVEAGLVGLASDVRAQANADQVLAKLGFSADDKERVLNGEYVSAKIAPVSERDLTFAVAFLVKRSPEAISQEIMAGNLVTADAQVQRYGKLSEPGSLADLAELQITREEANALWRAESGDKVNLSVGEIAAFKAEPSAAVQEIRQQLHRTLLARYQAYRSSGLDGIAPYDRSAKRATDVASDLRKATQAASALQEYLPALHAVLLGFPKVTLPGMEQQFFWMKSIIRGKPTYVLTHLLVASDGAARAVVRREFYVSTAYNCEQSIAGFLPVEGGTIVVYTSHVFTDQVAGTGGSLKRSIGSRVMADQMREIFDRGRKRIER
jgi:hypothetical protein